MIVYLDYKPIPEESMKPKLQSVAHDYYSPLEVDSKYPIIHYFIWCYIKSYPVSPREVCGSDSVVWSEDDLDELGQA